jgi:hypothetical protein
VLFDVPIEGNKRRLKEREYRAFDMALITAPEAGDLELPRNINTVSGRLLGDEW